jgi:cytochrome b561
MVQLYLLRRSVKGFLATAVGVYMSENEAFELYPIHKSIGVLIFAVIIVRVYWRFVNGWLQPVTEYKTIEHNLAKRF